MCVCVCVCLSLLVPLSFIRALPSPSLPLLSLSSQHGPPRTIADRASFFSKYSYVIGGLPYSCDDIEHGVLRNNQASPAHVLSLLGMKRLAPRTFAHGDRRQRMCIDPPDPRIHFALVCGAKSCPPIRLYSGSNVEEGLAGAAEAFCADDVAVDVARGIVTLSKIFKWYGGDFAKDKLGLLEAISAYRPDKDLRDLVAAKGKKIRVRYAEYDWGVNGKNAASS